MPTKRDAEWNDADEQLDEEDLLPADDEEETDSRRGRRQREDDDNEGDATGGVIPYKNPQALIAYYCGLFALLPFLGLFIGIAGFILGIQGLRAVKAKPQIRGQVHAWIGIIGGGFCAVAWGLCGVGIVIALLNQP